MAETDVHDPRPLDDDLEDAPAPPANTEAEQALLGAILANNGAYEKVAEFLEPGHFYDGVHARIYDACATAISKGQVANPVTLKSQFDQDEGLQEVGGSRYLIRLLRSVVTVLNARDYGLIILDMAQRREALGVTGFFSYKMTDGSVDSNAVEIIGQMQTELDNVINDHSIDRGGFVSLADAVQTSLQQTEKAFKGETIAGVKTGLIDLDNRLGGLMPGEMIVLAGRPAMGKTALGLSIAGNVSSTTQDDDRTLSVGLFSREMRREALARRLLASRTGIPINKQRFGDVDANDISRLVEGGNALSQQSLHIDDTARRISEIRLRSKQLRRKHGLDLIVVDYLQLIESSDLRRQDSRVVEITRITNELKALAMELDVPVLALSQLSRAVESREDKRPLLSDLRDSGSIEQDADVVLFVYREQYYLEQAEPVQRTDETVDKFLDRQERWQERMEAAAGLMEVNVAKQREGATGPTKVHFELATGRISNLARERYGNGQN